MTGPPRAPPDRGRTGVAFPECPALAGSTGWGAPWLQVHALIGGLALATGASWRSGSPPCSNAPRHPPAPQTAAAARQPPARRARHPPQSRSGKACSSPQAGTGAAPTSLGWGGGGPRSRKDRKHATGNVGRQPAFGRGGGLGRRRKARARTECTIAIARPPHQPPPPHRHQRCAMGAVGPLAPRCWVHGLGHGRGPWGVWLVVGGCADSVRGAARAEEGQGGRRTAAGPPPIPPRAPRNRARGHRAAPDPPSSASKRHSHGSLPPAQARSARAQAETAKARGPRPIPPRTRSK